MIISGAFEVAERILREILVPRRDVVTLSASLSAPQALRELGGSGQTRAPVVGPEGLDDTVGVVHLRDLLDFQSAGGAITREGLRINIEVGLLYLESWLGGNGAVAIHNLMEDAATAEICRSQIWQWVHNGSLLDDGTPVTAELVRELTAAQVAAFRAEFPDYSARQFETAARVFE